MTDPRPKQRPNTPSPEKQAKLAAALRANLQRRKAQARGREEDETPAAPETQD